MPTPHDKKTKRSARAIALEAVNKSLAEEQFVADTIAQWRQEESPSSQEAALALEIASGAIRMKSHLDWAALQVTDQKKLHLKRKEKALLRCAAYQLLFLNGVPAHAAVNESVKLGKQTCHPSFVKFLNALCRRLADEKPTPPKEDFALYYSYPSFLVDMLLESYDREQVRKILEAGNASPQTWVRRRNLDTPFPEGITQPEGAPPSCGVCTDTSILPALFEDPHYYLQNVAQVSLLESLLDRLPEPPKRILDLCASPGGKTLLLADRFPEAKIVANDISKAKIKRIKQNCEKYGIAIETHCGPGENYRSEEPFDLVVIDAPCSNSGTLGRRAEARWRFTPSKLKELEQIQTSLLENGEKLVSEKGHLLYLTCSICPMENQERVKGKKIVGEPLLHLLSEKGWDGGFGAFIKPRFT